MTGYDCHQCRVGVCYGLNLNCTAQAHVFNACLWLVVPCREATEPPVPEGAMQAAEVEKQAPVLPAVML